MRWWPKFRDCKRRWLAWNRFLICDHPCINHRSMADLLKEYTRSRCLTRKVLARSTPSHWSCWLPRLDNRLTLPSWSMISRLVNKMAHWSKSTDTGPTLACGETWPWTMWSTRRVTPPTVVHQRTSSPRSSSRLLSGITRIIRGWTSRT